MTDLTLERAPLRSFALPQIFRGEPAFAAAGLLMFWLMLPTAAAALLDRRQLLGVSVWDKPLKFQLALGIYLLTLALFASWLPAGFVAGRRYRVYAASVLVAIGLEMAWLMGAAALGVASHFNASGIGTLIYRTMGGLAIWLTSASLVYGVVIARRGREFGNPALRDGIAIGLMLVLPLTLVTAGFMSAWGSHFVGGVASDAGGLWLMGWARDGGDLRVAHFFATHALHVVPVLALASSAVLGKTRRWPVRLGAALFVAFVAYAFVEALSGRPFLGFIG